MVFRGGPPFFEQKFFYLANHSFKQTTNKNPSKQKALFPNIEEIRSIKREKIRWEKKSLLWSLLDTDISTVFYRLLTSSGLELITSSFGLLELFLKIN